VAKKLYYKIGEACKLLEIQPYVLRYWETEFPALNPSKSRSGQRVYSERELEIIRRIKQLLYEEGYTIAGAKKKLEGESAPGADTDTGPILAPPRPSAGVADAARRSRTAQRRDPAQETPPAAVHPQPVPEEAAAVQLDTPGDLRVERLRRGIARALDEARAVLALLDSGSPPRSDR
jgi:DNA-binding transcriptional MerR regulator